MRILHWHVHAAWTTSFVRGPHEYLIPVLPDRGADGRGLAETYPWPGSAVAVGPEELRDAPIDVVVLQRPHEIDLCEAWTGRRPGRDVPAVLVEHNAPQGRIADMRHPLAGQDAIPVVHVTHFNALFWDTGSAPVRIVEHGILDPGPRYSGELPRAAVVVNEARRRGRVTGTDLLGRLGSAAPIDLFGIDAASLGGIEDLPWARLHEEVARRRVYLHPIRWTSLGLSLLECMHLGMPVVALATTEVRDAVPDAAGFVSNRLDVLEAGLRELVADPEQAAERGRAAREAALAALLARALPRRLGGRAGVGGGSAHAGCARLSHAPTGPVARIAVVRALPGLGDLLCLTPALRALREAFPAARIELIGLAQAEGLVARLAARVDELVPFPGFPGLPEVPFEQARLDAFVAGARARSYDLALQLHGSGEQSAAFTALLGARVVAGYGPAPPFLPPAHDLHELRRPLRVLAALGIPARGEGMELALGPGDERDAAPLRPPAPYAVLHPGAADPARRWPPQRFAAVADALAERGLVPVLTGTPGEAPATRRVRGLMAGPALDLTGRTSLGALAVLLRDAAVTVTNDTGTSHVAAAVGGRSVVVFRASDPARWAPLDGARHVALPPPLERPQPGDALPPLADVGVGDAVRAVDELLG